MTAALLVTALAGCGNRTPKRDYIPVLKQQVYRLQEAVKSKNRAAIDSLLSPSILAKQESSDSLLSYVYGPDGSFDFRQFGSVAIAYTNDKARIDAYVMDSTRSHDRPIAFSLELKGNLWLVTEFGPGEPDSVSAVDTSSAPR